MPTMHLGIEIEYLIMDKAGQPVMSGFGKRGSDARGAAILKKAGNDLGCPSPEWDGTHEVYKDFKDSALKGAKLLPDTFTLLETVTHHSDELAFLQKQLWGLKRALIKAAKSDDCKVSGSACPIAYNYEVIKHEKCTFNNAGMHIHIDAEEDREKIKLQNLLIQVIPELTALSANSSVYNGKKSGYATNRLAVSTLVSAKMVELLEVDPDKPLDWGDPNARYRWVTPYAKAKRTVEIRGFDTPMTIDWAIAIAALVLCIGEKSKKLFLNAKANTIVSRKKKYRIENFEEARKHGLKATFMVDPSFHRKIEGRGDVPLSFLYHDPNADDNDKIPAHLAVKRLLYYVEDEVARLKVAEYLEPIFRAVKEVKNQADIQLELFDESHGDKDAFAKSLCQRAEAEPTQRKPKGSSLKYFRTRQRTKAAGRNEIEMSKKGMERIGKKEGDRIIVSGPLGSIGQKLAADHRTSGRGLADEEVGLSPFVRRALGVSMYDPVILDNEERTPLVIEMSGKEWFSIKKSKPAERTLKVRKGFKEYGQGKAVVSPDFVRRLGASEGTQVYVWKTKAKFASLQLVVKDNLRTDALALMKADRDTIRAEEGDAVAVSLKQPDGGASPAPEDGFKVIKGSKDDADDPAVIRLSPKAIDTIDVVDGDSIWIYAEDGKKLEAVVKSDGEIKERQAGLREKARTELGIKVGDRITLKHAGSTPSDDPEPDTDLEEETEGGVEED